MDNVPNVTSNEVPNQINIFDTLQDVDKTIFLKITESIQALRTIKHKLDLKINKTPDDEAKLIEIQEQLDREINELDKYFDLSSQLLTNMEQHTLDHIGLSPEKIRNNVLDSNKNVFNGEFHQVLVLKRDESNALPPRVMILNSTTNCKEIPATDQLNCSSSTDCSTCETDKSGNSSESKESIDIPLLKKCVCDLKQCLKNIVNQNQDLRFQLKSKIKQNALYEKCLACPAPFKKSLKGNIYFPGKKIMEEKLLATKNIIIHLNHEVAEVQKAKLKLKLVRDFVTKYINTAVNCQCEDQITKESKSKDTIIKVKNQKNEQMKLQLKHKNDELNNMIRDYNNSVKMNEQFTIQINQLIKEIAYYKADIEKFQIDGVEDPMDELNKRNEEIEVMELVIKKRREELGSYDEKLMELQCENRNLADKTDQLEAELKTITKTFTDTYHKLESDYQEQLEDIMALPVVLKAMHLKLQEEIDERVLAEETRDKLEREIIEAEASSKSAPIEEDQSLILEKLTCENETILSRLKHLEYDIERCTARLDKKAQGLEGIVEQIQEAITESDRHINAFNRFSTIIMERLVADVNAVKDILAELQRKECAKVIIKKTVMDHLREKISSIHQNVNECKSKVNAFLDQSSLEMCCSSSVIQINL